MQRRNSPIIDQLRAVSKLARTGDYPNAALGFNRCALLLQEHLRRHGPTPGGVDANITYSLQTMLLMLKNNDWVALADVIDFEFLPLWKRANPS